VAKPRTIGKLSQQYKTAASKRPPFCIVIQNFLLPHENNSCESATFPGESLYTLLLVGVKSDIRFE
jgi:hypothetical protein